ncbi:hypothetical protein AB0910_13825 [Streptomyces sp. NPDC047002]|uniref:hypothetical protein n=1 Tax=Streptomyces sp. NPDC047002 TaxID=3155475 RepID=UPI003453544B
MTSTRRIVTFLALAAGASGLGVSTASTASAAVGPLVQPQSISVADTVDDLSTASVPADQKAQVPTATQQLQGLNQLQQLHQLTDLVAPVTGLLPSLQ